MEMSIHVYNLLKVCADRHPRSIYPIHNARCMQDFYEIGECKSTLGTHNSIEVIMN